MSFGEDNDAGRLSPVKEADEAMHESDRSETNNSIWKQYYAPCRRNILSNISRAHASSSSSLPVLCST